MAGTTATLHNATSPAKLNCLFMMLPSLGIEQGARQFEPARPISSLF
jgi:hypothetical protein